jgi:hypothetical protein
MGSNMTDDVTGIACCYDSSAEDEYSSLERD